MVQWIIVSAIGVVVILLVVRYIIRQFRRKNDGCGCGCGCSRK
ncbi:MAG: FeoB-associated Cys-rich membrane protein [Bacteroides sp.]